MSTRRQAREIALQILYRYDISASQSAAEPLKKLDLASDPVKLIQDLDQHFEHFKIPDDIRTFVSELVSGTLIHLPELDQLIEKHATNWKVARISAIDRNLLRMAIYEMGHFPDIPVSVTMDEAIELSKQFGNTDSSSFINGILDAVKQEKTA